MLPAEWICAHCGRGMRDYREASHEVEGQVSPLCHPTRDSSLPDCYRRVLVYRERLGILWGVASPPSGITGIMDPDQLPELDWSALRDTYEGALESGGQTQLAVFAIRAVFERWRLLERRAQVAEDNGRRLLTYDRQELSAWRYRMLRMMASRQGRDSVQDRLAEQEGWW